MPSGAARTRRTNVDLREAQERDRQHRMEQARRIQKDSSVNSGGRFDLATRRAGEDAARIAAARRAEVVALLSRTLGRTPTEAEIIEVLER
jgi:hypothetical protein